MSTLPEITESLATAFAKGDLSHARSLCFMAASKMGGERGERIQKALKWGQENEVKLKHWNVVNEVRSPWVHDKVSQALEQWLNEAKHSEALLAAGEKVMPLLLTGETRCGKTSSLCAIAQKLGLEVRRMSLASVTHSFMGESTKLMKAAFEEARVFSDKPRLWLVDEIDGVAQKRLGGQAAEQERASAVSSLLTEVESLPPWVMLAATSNTSELIDPAVLSRFTVVGFPKWAELAVAERWAFADSHGNRVFGGESYSEVVQKARTQRVAEIIAKIAGESK